MCTGEVTCIKLTGRYGDSTALSTGLDAARFESILVLPPYPQIDSAELPNIIASLKDHDLIYAERRRTADSAVNRIQGKVFSWMINRVADVPVQDAGCEVRAMRREVANQLVFHGDLHTFLPLLAHRLGFSVRGITVGQSEKDRNARLRNPLVYLRRLIDILNIAFLTKFTKKPLRFFGMIGSSLILMGGVILAYIVFERLAFDVELGTRPALFIGALMAVVGVQILAVGLVGEIITFAHAGKSKEYQVKEVVGARSVYRQWPIG